MTNSNNFCDSDLSNEETKPNPFLSSHITTVIPPTTIVCLPSLIPVSNALLHQSTNVQSAYISSPNITTSTNSKVSTHSQHQQNILTNKGHRPSISLSLPPNATQHHRSSIVASSSSLPYLSLATTLPLRAVTTINQSKNKAPIKGGRGSRTNSNRPPPGAVNLERSYQICQAVIQNSPNRHQLKAQLRPPPSMLGSTTNVANNTKKDDNLSTSGKIVISVHKLMQ